MQPGIQPTIATRGADTQPTPNVRVTETEISLDTTTAVTPAAKAVPFWRGVIAASIVVLLISAILAGILLILPAAH